MGIRGLISGETEALYAELNEGAKKATSSYSATGDLQYIYFNFSIFILCL